MKTLIDIKKHSNALARLVATVQLKDYGVDCYFENASQAIGLGYSRSEILEALNKDIGKTADDLFNSQAIIKSIQNGKVIEFDSICNTVEDVFGSTYNKEKETITLSGVCFTIGGVGSLTKAELSSIILQSLFGIERKELSGVLKTLTRYEETTDDVQKAILYPSTILADELIGKITDQEIAYSTFKKALSYEEESEFNKTFNRTGVTGVIQNATYINTDGIKQLAPSHKAKDANELEILLKGGKLKYIEAVECDGDGSLEKMTTLVKQVEKLELNTKVKFTFKARKLGNLKARGVFFPGHLIVAEDVRDTSAVLHELGHLIHMISHADDPFVNYLISKLTPMVDMDNVKFPISRNADYYLDPKEVVARACEIGGLFARREGRDAFADDATFDLIKSDQYYADQEGIYFNFTQFDETTTQELIALYELFYETSPDEVRSSRFDNFIKIDTNYRKEKKSFDDILEDWASKKEKELREIYSLVKHSTINPIIKNRGQATLTELTMAIFTNISYCGNHNARMTSKDWADVIEDKAAVICTLFDSLEANMSEKEMFLFRARLPRSAAWKRVNTTVLLSGFTDKFRPLIKKDLQAIGATCYGEVIEIQKNLRTIDDSLTAAMLSDEAFMDEVISVSPETIARLDATMVDMETLVRWTRKILNARPQNNRYSAFVINKALGDHLEFMDEAIEGNPMLISMAGDAYTNNAYRMLKYITDRADSNFESLRYIGDELKDSVEFATPFVKINGQAIQYFSDRVKTELANAGEVNLIAMEIKKLEEADTKYRRKVARKTDNVKIIEFLAKDRNEEIRIEVAKRDITPPEILEGYAKRKSVWLKGAVAENANTPLPVLKAMIKTERDSHVFCSLAKNPNLTLSDFLVLVKQPERYTRLMVLCNQKIAGFMHGGKLSVLREIVKTALAGNEEYFAYEMKVSSKFKPSIELLEDMKNNISLYADMFPNMLLQVVNEMIESRFPHKVEKAEIVLVVPEDIALGGLFAS
jgi:uncharacterized membrane-anchored protein YjiN (DUF445 family)